MTDASQDPRPLPPRARSSARPAPPPTRPPGFEDWDAEPESGGDPGLEHYVRILLRRRRLLLAVALAVAGLAALQAFTATPLYRASATLEVEAAGQNILPYEGLEPSEQRSFRFQDYLATLVARLESRSFHQRVWRKLQATGHPALHARVRRGLPLDLGPGLRRLALLPFRGGDASESERIGRLSDSIEIEIVRNTSLLRVSFTSPDPELSALGANLVAREFIDQSLEGRHRAATHATEFLAGQLDELEARVAESEARLLRYGRDHGMVNLDARRTNARKRLADLSDALTRAETELIALEARAAAAALEGGGLPDALKSEHLRGIETRVADRELELAGLAARFGPEWPAVEKLRLEIEALGRHAVAETERIAAAAQGAQRLARSEHARLSAAIEEQRRLVDQLDERSIRHDILKRESDSSKQLYEGLLQRLAQANVAARLESTNLQIVEDAEPPHSPSSPRKARTLLLALVLGLFLGTAAAVLAERVELTRSTRGSPVATLLIVLVAALVAWPTGTAHAQEAAGGERTDRPAAALTVGAGDVLVVDVFGIAELGRRVRIADDGTVNLPLLGEVEIGGLRLAEAERRIAALLEERELVKSPQVSIFVEEAVSSRVTVQGAVAAPGVYPLVASTTLLEVLAWAGGVAGDSVGGDIVVLRRRADGEYERLEVDADALLRLGDPARNLRVEPGDVVMVPPPRLARVYVTGAVVEPGIVEYSTGDGITVLQAITAAGGPRSRARLRDVQVLRRLPGGEQRFPLDVRAILGGAAEDVPLEPNDTVLVGAGSPRR